MRLACWIPKATNTHSEYLILTAFPLQQWLNKGVSLIRYTYTACLVKYYLDCCRVETALGHPPPLMTCSSLWGLRYSAPHLSLFAARRLEMKSWSHFNDRSVQKNWTSDFKVFLKVCAPIERLRNEMSRSLCPLGSHNCPPKYKNVRILFRSLLALNLYEHIVTELVQCRVLTKSTCLN